MNVDRTCCVEDTQRVNRLEARPAPIHQTCHVLREDPTGVRGSIGGGRRGGDGEGILC